MLLKRLVFLSMIVSLSSVLSACYGFTSVGTFRSGSGGKIVYVSCLAGERDSCYEKASLNCPRGYRLLSERQTQSVRVPNFSNDDRILALDLEMRIECQ